MDMFTGIVEQTLQVIGLAKGPGFTRLTVSNPWTDVRDGQSVAINGCCLTAAEISESEIGFDVVPQTLSLTNLGQLNEGEHVNAERALRLGDRLDGHFVQGHIDGLGELVGIEAKKEVRLKIRPPRHLVKFIVPQGSITVDGVSLTVAAKLQDVFEVALIPTTIQLTTLSKVRAGWLFNLEADMLAKTVVHFLEQSKLESPKS